MLNVLLHLTHLAKKENMKKIFAFPEKANTSVIYMNNVANLLSTMLTKSVYVPENTKKQEKETSGNRK